MEGNVDSSEWHGGYTALELNGLGFGLGGAGTLMEGFQDAGTNLLEGLGALENGLEVRLTALDFAD